MHVNSTSSALLPKGTTAQRPAAGIEGMIRYNTDEDAFEYYDGLSWLGFGTVFTLITADNFSGDNSTTVFALSQSTTTAATIVAINGVVQEATTAYSVSGSTLTFTEAPASGDNIDVRILTTTTTVDSLSSNDGNASINMIGGASNIANVTANVLPTANASYDLGSTSFRWNNIWGVTTSAVYADLAEYYASDLEYEAGTVVKFGGEQEITICNEDMSSKIAGVISTAPAFAMNDSMQSEHPLPVSLQGRVPTKVYGPVSKGDMMVSAGNGYARAEANPKIGTVIGKALADFEGTEGVIEVVIGRV